MTENPRVPPTPPEERYGPLVHRRVHHGAILYIVGVLEFLVGMIVTQVGWDLKSGNPTYSLAHNYISDFGAVSCGEIAGRYVCSPWHLVFNISIVVMGILLIFGTLLIISAFPARATRTVGLGLLIISAFGSIGVGLSPEDVNLTVHTLSALAAFLAANIALMVLGIAMFRDTRWNGYRGFTILCGLVGFVALLLFVAKAWTWGGFFGDWGVGGIERTIVAPVLLWALVAGIHLLRIRTYAPRLLPGVTST